MSTPMKIVAQSISAAAAKDLLRLSPLAARTSPLLPPQPRLVIERVRITCSKDTEQLLISCYRASDAGTGTLCTADAVDLQGGGQTLAGTAVKDLTVAATKVALLDSQQVAMTLGVELCDDDGDYHVLPGQHFVVRLDTTPAAPPVALTVEVEFRQI